MRMRSFVAAASAALALLVWPATAKARKHPERKIIDSPEMREREARLGYRFIGGPPEKLDAWVKAEIEKWASPAKKGAFGPN